MDPIEQLRTLPRPMREQLLRVLTAADADRANVIGQLWQRGQTGIAEALIECEGDEIARARLIDCFDRAQREPA